MRVRHDESSSRNSTERSHVQTLEIMRHIKSLLDGKSAHILTGGEGVNEGAVYAFCLENSLLGYIYPYLSNLPSNSLLLGRARKVYLRQEVNNLRLLAELETILELLGLPEDKVIVFKGPTFCQKYFGDLGRKRSHDVDLLLTERTFLSGAIGKLLDAGFRCPAPFLPLGLRTYFTHSIAFHCKNLKLDLHWRLRNFGAFRISNEELLQSAETFETRSKSFLTLSDEYSLVAQILSIVNDILHENLSFRLYFDTLAIMEKFQEKYSWEEFFEKRTRENLFICSLNALHLVISVFNAWDEFDQLSTVFENNKGLIFCKNPQLQVTLGRGTPWSIRGKDWAFESMGHGYLRNFMWWISSFPIRVLSHGFKLKTLK